MFRVRLLIRLKRLPADDFGVSCGNKLLKYFGCFYNYVNIFALGIILRPCQKYVQADQLIQKVTVLRSNVKYTLYRRVEPKILGHKPHVTHTVRFIGQCGFLQ